MQNKKFRTGSDYVVNRVRAIKLSDSSTVFGAMITTRGVNWTSQGMTAAGPNDEVAHLYVATSSVTPGDYAIVEILGPEIGTYNTLVEAQAVASVF